MEKSYSNKIVIFALFAIGIFLFFRFLNTQINNALKTDQIKSSPEIVETIKQKIVEAKSIESDDIKGWVRLESNRQYVEHVFLLDGKEIARFKTKDDKVFDYQGAKFTGMVEFKDYTKNSYGTQMYVDGIRNGALKEYYDTGQIQREIEYFDNTIISEKQYFADGILRMESYFNDASQFTSDHDVGEGKVYFRNGTLRYEWRFLSSESGGFNKSYNLDGVLVEENYFDSFGEPISKEAYYQGVSAL